jgi:hypothetical protein
MARLEVIGSGKQPSLRRYGKTYARKKFLDCLFPYCERHFNLKRIKELQVQAQADAIKPFLRQILRHKRSFCQNSWLKGCNSVRF